MTRRRILGLEVEVLVAFLAIAFLAFVFVAIASEMAEGDTLAWDRQILTALRATADPSHPVGPDWLLKSMRDLTALGGVSVLTLVTVVVTGYLAASRRIGLALFVALSTIGGAIGGTILKELFLRPRPLVVPHLVDVDSLSFPSGHALNSAVIYLTLGALLARAEARPSVRIYVIGVAIFLTMLIGISRVYLGVHYPSDVLAGWCAGAAWAATSSSIARMLQRRRQLEPATGEGEPHDEGP
jgi:undecaprenyl-diphosphatase